MTNHYPTDNFEAEIAATPLDILTDQDGGHDFTNVWLHLKLAARLDSVVAESHPLVNYLSPFVCPGVYPGGKCELVRGLKLLARSVMEAKDDDEAGLHQLFPLNWGEVSAAFSKYTSVLEWELNHYEGDQLGQAMVDVQDLACLRAITGYGRHWLRNVFRNPVDCLVDMANATTLDDVAAKYLRNFKERFPIHEDHQILNVACPVGISEAALMMEMVRFRPPIIGRSEQT